MELCGHTSEDWSQAGLAFRFGATIRRFSELVNADDVHQSEAPAHNRSVEDAPRPNVDTNVDAADMNVHATVGGRGLIELGGPEGHGYSLTVAAQPLHIRSVEDAPGRTSTRMSKLQT